VLQCVSVFYSVLQCVAVYCSVLQCVVVCCSAYYVCECASYTKCVSMLSSDFFDVLQNVAVCSVRMQRVAVCCSMERCSVLQYIAVRCSVLQCVAVCCIVLQCVAVHCSVLQCVAVCCIASCARMLSLLARLWPTSYILTTKIHLFNLRLYALYVYKTFVHHQHVTSVRLSERVCMLFDLTFI